jgi:tetratricopeptide (TPR) repeat protein
LPLSAQAALLAEGDKLFGQQRYDDARARYEAAARADPQLSTAWLVAGDCYFHQQDRGGAEALFRRAAEIEPAILALLYRRAYAPALDAWQAAHPGGVQAFIDRHGLCP